jgi:hypothetical protein
MNNAYKIIIALSFTLLISCTKDFEDINVNPNTAVDVQPEFLLRKVLYDYTEQMSYEGFVAGNLLGQYFTAIDFNLFDRHSLSEPQYGGKPWNFMYENLRDNEILLAKSRSNLAAAVYEGPALIYKAYVTAALTDLFGDVPYSEAFQGKSGIVTPKYDNQRDIYLAEGGIIDNLEKGIAAIDGYKGAIPLQGDIVFNGDLTKWKKLANSLKFKALMRISAKEDVKAALQKIVDDDNFIKNPSENAVFTFIQSPPNNFRLSTAKVGDYNLFIMSETIDSIMKVFDDPRKTKYFRPTAADPNVYRGLRNGPDASQLSITTSQYSLTGRIFREEAGSLRANIMTSWEMNFLLAEAAEKGLIAGNSQTYYETGINQAFNFWNVAMPANYLTHEKVSYKIDGNNPIEQIITQKWLGNIINGYEGWIEYRRTGFPALKPVTASLNQGLFPVRMPYPTSEDALNNANFRVAADKTNNNSVNAPVWWDQ